MREQDYTTQINLYKGLRNSCERICGKFELRYSHSKYKLFGEYYPETDEMVWTLFRYKCGRIQSLDSVPKTIIRFMTEVEWQVKKEWKSFEDNIWHNEEV